MKTLIGERVILRDWQESDLAEFYEYAKNPKVGPMAGWPPHKSIEDSAKILKIFIEKKADWCITDKQTGKVIGSFGIYGGTGLFKNNPTGATIGYVLAEPYWGKGLMLECVKLVLAHAFNDLDYDIVCVEHFPFNTQSKRVIEKVGFKYQGLLRQVYRRYDNQVFDGASYTITKDEFLAQNQ